MDPNQPQLHNQPQYQPYPQQYQQAPRQYIPHSKPWHITKIVLYSLSIAFCVIVLGLSIALVVDSEYYQSSQIIWVAPQAGAALIWDIAELITVCARSGKRGIHPGAHVALHLLLWLAFICATGLTAWILVYAYECDYYCRYYSNDDYYSSSPYFPIIQAELAFLALLILTHFILFVRACVETHQRNRLAGPVIMVPSQEYYSQVVAQHQPQMMQPMQQSYPSQPQQAHTSGYYEQPKEGHHFANSTNSANLQHNEAHAV